MQEAEGRDSSLEPRAKAVLQAAREMTEGTGVSDATFAALRRGLDNEQVVDLVMTIAFYNAVVRVLDTLQIDVEDDYKKFLEEFPLPERARGSA
jgi:alkylhydroperoxidase family enzyme